MLDSGVGAFGGATLLDVHETQKPLVFDGDGVAEVDLFFVQPDLSLILKSSSQFRNWWVILVPYTS